ncbi:MAG: arginase [Acidobacteria bacterium]|nr:arginase [Acidobacteriota bacterium]
MDLGAGRRGVDMGPSAIRIGGLHQKLREMGFEVEDGGNIEVRLPEEQHYGEKKKMYLNEISQVCEQLAQRVALAHGAEKLPVILGGDHSLAAGSIAGTAVHYRDGGKKIGLIWIDAHTDMNTPETSPSGNVHGMPLAAVLGLGPPELCNIRGFSPKVDVANVIMIGARSIDRRERDNIKKSHLRVVTMKELDMRGLKSVMEEALERATDGTEGFHCSVDLDVVDPQVAPGVGTPVRGGMTYRESHLAMEMISDSSRLLSLEVVEVNPVLDAGNSTGILAVELICSALGKKIL